MLLLCGLIAYRMFIGWCPWRFESLCQQCCFASPPFLFHLVLHAFHILHTFWCCWPFGRRVTQHFYNLMVLMRCFMAIARRVFSSRKCNEQASGKECALDATNIQFHGRLQQQGNKHYVYGWDPFGSRPFAFQMKYMLLLKIMFKQFVLLVCIITGIYVPTMFEQLQL